MLNPSLSFASLLAALPPIKMPEGKNAPIRTSVGKDIASPREQLIILGVALALGILIFLWVYLFRKRKAADNPRSPSARVILDEKPESHSGRKRRKWREKRRDHRARNPTLAETGGLPPTRPNEGERPT